MRVFITGAGGFVGGHLIDHLLGLPNLELYAGVLFPPGQNPRLDGRPVIQRQCDLRDAAAVQAVVDAVQPDLVFHLAAMAEVARSFKAPWETLANNIGAQVHLLEALRVTNRQARVLVVSSAEIYGAAGGILNEDVPFAPTNPYSVSKVAQDMLGLQYFLAYDMPIVRARPFNHLGPSQAGGFAASDFASQIAAIEAGQHPPVMYVGNLNAERDFTDVRDVVRAYYLMLTQGDPGAVYHVCSGQGHSIQTVLDMLLSMSSVQIEVRQDPARMRPVDVPCRVGDASRLHARTGWEPVIPLEQSLRDILDDWRRRVSHAPESR